MGDELRDRTGTGGQPRGLCGGLVLGDGWGDGNNGQRQGGTQDGDAHVGKLSRALEALPVGHVIMRP